MAATSITTAAPAKINLTLHVLGTRPDGFHNLESLVVGVDLCDQVRCGILSQPGLEVTCTDSALANRDNLAARAVERCDVAHPRPSYVMPGGDDDTVCRAAAPQDVGLVQLRRPRATVHSNAFPDGLGERFSFFEPFA